MSGTKLLLEKEVRAKTRLSGATLWRLERAGKFPRRIKIGTKRVAWSEDEVDRYTPTASPAERRRWLHESGHECEEPRRADHRRGFD